MAFQACVAMRNPLLERRHRARGRLSLARRDGNEDDVLAHATHAAIGRARAEDDLEGISTAVSNAGSLMDALAAERDDIAAGVPTGGTRDAEAYVLVAQRQGACAVEVQNETNAVDEEREKFEQHRIENGARLSGNIAGKAGRNTMTVDGQTLQVLREKGVQDQAAYRERGCVPKDYDGTESEHIELLDKKQSYDLAYDRSRRRLAWKGIEKGSLPADVKPKIVEGRRLFAVYGVKCPPDEKCELYYETPEEAFAVATRWREFWDKPRDAVRAAKAERGGVPNVNAHKTKDNLFCVMYCSKHRGKSRFVREPGTGGSWYYDWDAALDLKADYEKSNKDASWFVSAAEVKAAGKESQKASLAKARASRKRKAEP